MKKVISVAIAFIMALTSFQAVAFAQVPTLSSVRVVSNPNKTECVANVEFDEHLLNEIVDLDGLQIEATYSDGSVENLYYDVWRFEDEDYNSNYDFTLDYGDARCDNPEEDLVSYCFSLGDNKISIMYCGVEYASFVLTGVESSVSSLEIQTPPNYVVYEGQYSSIEEGQENPVYDISKIVYDIIRDGSVTYYYKNGENEVVNECYSSASWNDYCVLHGIGKTEASVEFTGNQYEKPWTIGDNKVSYTDAKNGVSGEFTVTIVENPISSINLNIKDGAVIREGYDIVYSFGEEGYDYYGYDVNAFIHDNCTVTVNYKSGAISNIDLVNTVYNSYTDCYDDEESGLSFSFSNNLHDYGWHVGSNNNFIYVTCLGLQSRASVTMVENPVDYIEAQEAVFYEGVDCFTDYDSGITYYYLNTWNKKKEYIINIHFKDESVKTFNTASDECAFGEFNYYYVGDGARRPIIFSHTSKDGWVVGSNKNAILVEFLGKECYMDAKLVKNFTEPCNHSMILTSTVPATCVNNGTNTYVCDFCGYTTYQPIAPLGHNFANNAQYCLNGCQTANPSYIAPVVPVNQTPATTSQSPKSVKVSGVTYTKNSKGEYVGKAAKKSSVSSVKKGKKSFKVTYKKVSNVSGYQVQYSTSKKFTKKTTSTKTYKGNKSLTKTISNLKSGKTYYVRVRTYKTAKIDGKSVRVYSEWSKTKSVKTK